MHRRTSRLNHLALTVVGILLLAAGAYLVLRHLGRLGPRQPSHVDVLTPGGLHWLHHDSWVWLVVAAVALVVALAALRWVLVQPRIDRIRTLRVDRDLHTAGHTRMSADVLTDAVERDLLGYPGIERARVMVIGAVDAPELIVRIQLRPRAELAAAYELLVGEALPSARIALDDDAVAAQVHVVISGRAAREAP